MWLGGRDLLAWSHYLYLSLKSLLCSKAVYFVNIFVVAYDSNTTFKYMLSRSIYHIVSKGLSRTVLQHSYERIYDFGIQISSGDELTCLFLRESHSCRIWRKHRIYVMYMFKILRFDTSSWKLYTKVQKNYIK